MKRLERLVEYGLYVFLFILPWQTRWIWQPGLLNNGVWEYGTFSLYAWDIVLILLVLLRLAQQQRVGIRMERRFWIPLVVLFFFSLASVLFSQNREISWYILVRLAQGLALVWLIAATRWRWTIVAATLISAGFIQAVIGIYQFFTQSVMSNKWLGWAAHDPGVLGDFVVETASGRFLRAYGSLPHPNMLAGFLVICLLLTIGFLIRLHPKKRANSIGIILNVTAFVVMSFALTLTFSRSAWIAFGVAFLFLISLAIWQGSAARTRVLIQVAVWVILLTSFSILLLPDVWQTRLTDPGRLEQQSSMERTDQIIVAWNYITGYWYQGTGIGAYTQALHDSNPNWPSWQYQPVHMIYLLVPAELGAVPGILFLYIIARLFMYTGNRYGRLLLARDTWFLICTSIFIALVVIGLFDHYLWTLATGTLLWWLIYGLWARQRTGRHVDNTRI